MRIYLSKIAGTGTEGDPFYPAWWDIIAPGSVNRHGVTESRRYHFWIGQIDTDASQHSALIADNRIRWINDALLNQEWNQLTQPQKNQIIEIITWLNFDARNLTDIFSNTTRIRDVLFWLLGKSCWTGLRSFEEPLP